MICMSLERSKHVDMKNNVSNLWIYWNVKGERNGGKERCKNGCNDRRRASRMIVESQESTGGKRVDHKKKK